MKTLRSLKILVAASALAALFATHSAQAAARYWNAGTGTWDSIANWSASAAGATGQTAPIAGDTATFNGSLVIGNETVYLNGNRATALETFNNTGSTTLLGGISGTSSNNTLTLSAGLTISSGAGAVTIGDTSVSPTANVDLVLTGSQTFTNTSSSLLTVANGITSNSANATVLTIAGAGTGNQTYSGVIGDGSGGGTVAVTVTDSGGVVTLSGNNTNTGLTSITAATGTLILSGSKTGAGNTTLTNGNLVLGNKAALGSGKLALTAGTLSASTDLSGGDAIANAVQLQNAGSLIIGGSNNLTFSGVVKEHATATRTLTVNNSGTTTFSGTLGLSDGSAGNTLIINGTGAVVVSGTLSNGGGSGTDNGGASSYLTYSGSNILTLSGANIYTGPTTISSGIVSLNSLANGGVATAVGMITVSGSPTATITNTAGLVVGQTIIQQNASGGNSGIAPGTTILAITPNTSITLSQNAVASVSAGGYAGTPNSLGLSTKAATNLMIGGGTLQYTGGAASTDRLFTIAPGGATIDAEGASNAALSFTNTGTQSPDLAAAVGTVATNVVTLTTGNTNSLTVGMAVNDSAGALGSGATITAITSGTTFTLSTIPGTLASGTITYGLGIRPLTLTGSSTGANAIAGILKDGATVNGTAGTLSLTKNGTGTWALSGNNSYTGATTVSAGTLLISAGGNINTSGSVSVASGATLNNANGTSITPALTLQEGATLVSSAASSTFAPTASLTLSGNLSDGWTMIALTNSGGSATLLTKGGALTLALTGITAGTFNLTSATGFAGSFTSANVNGSTLTQSGADFSGSDGSFNYAFTNATDVLVVTVPEPATWGLLAFSLTTVLVLRRRRG